MCLNCGCGQPNERHGNAANITADDVRRAGEANGQDLTTTAANIRSALDALPRQETTGGHVTAGAAAGASTGTNTTRAPR